MKPPSPWMNFANLKLNEKIENTAKLRKEIINYTNNFHEFKILKSDIIETLLENENGLKQLSTIVQLMNDQINMQREHGDSLLTQLETSRITIEKVQEENMRIKRDIDDLSIQIDTLNISEKEKNICINDLLLKVNFLENVVCDYQKRVYITKYDKIFKIKSPFRNEDLMKKFYDKYIPLDHASLDYPYLDYTNTFKNFIHRSYLDYYLPEKMRNDNTTIYPSIQNRRRSSNAIVSDNKNSKQEGKLFNNSVMLIKRLQSLNSDSYTSTFLKNQNPKLRNKYTFSVYNDSTSKEKDFQYDKNIDNINPSNNISYKEAAYLSQSQQYTHTTNGQFKHSPTNNTNKALFEKDRASLVSELLLKIFSSKSISSSLKRKFGENFEMKLTDKESETDFILSVEKEVDDLLKKEKEREAIIRERLAINKAKRYLNIPFSAKRSVSSDFEIEKEGNNQKKKSFNHYTKNISNYFDPKLQYGGESCVPNSTKRQTIDKLNLSREINSNRKKNKKKFPLSIDTTCKNYRRREFSGGWNTLKEISASENKLNELN